MGISVDAEGHAEQERLIFAVRVLHVEGGCLLKGLDAELGNAVELLVGVKRLPHVGVEDGSGRVLFRLENLLRTWMNYFSAVS